MSQPSQATSQTKQMTQPPQMSMPSQFQERYKRVQADLESLQKSVQEMTEKVTSEDGMVTVTVGAKGEVLELELSPRIYRTTDSKALAENIKQTVWKASASVTAKLVELITPVLGDNINGMQLKDQLDRVPDAGKVTN